MGRQLRQSSEPQGNLTELICRRRGCRRPQGRTVHGAYGAEMRELRRLMRALDEEQRRVLELVK